MSAGLSTAVLMSSSLTARTLPPRAVIRGVDGKVSALNVLVPPNCACEGTKQATANMVIRILNIIVLTNYIY